ncbi:hypothetical protein Asuc_0961 [Actinobacillus succinogenes 130Z]|uniref:LexA regulated protein n=1 Tax=Actinobacillus succinogenes (strain ATCC 55618 / DSM 22257 / CCUG 43843 / 130Z) TaxID=339671 RepID=A6VMY2_ACTSZ|nr:hypothetical protein Asuc_0961 [Actinobacillus succinogenes 130Z]
MRMIFNKSANLHMAKQSADCITLDLFADERRVGRPRSNPLSREQQIRINKRNQLRRDKSSGLKTCRIKITRLVSSTIRRIGVNARHLPGGINRKHFTKLL